MKAEEPSYLVCNKRMNCDNCDYLVDRYCTGVLHKDVHFTAIKTRIENHIDYLKNYNYLIIQEPSEHLCLSHSHLVGLEYDIKLTIINRENNERKTD